MILETIPVGPLQCNCSILGDEISHEAIVVDPGDDIPRILALLARHKLRVAQILITHAHIDHIAGAARLKALTGAPILYNPRDLELVKMMDLQASWLGIATPDVPPPDDTLDDGRIITLAAAPDTSPQNPPLGVAAGLSPSDKMSPSSRAQPRSGGAEGPPHSSFVDSASKIEPSAPAPPLTGQILHTPGHTQGSVCLYLPDHNLLLAGDTLFAGSVGRTDLPGGDGRALLNSIHSRLLPLPENTLVVPGHGEETTLGEERETNPFLQPGIRL
jgi:glyoxylase-like metal-dependent hydrolase (beta-lactamase superfamily II)